MVKPKDFLRQELSIGDKVLRIHGGNNTGYFGFAKVVGFTPKKVKLESWKRDWKELTYSDPRYTSNTKFKWGISNLDAEKIVKIN